MSCDAPDSSRSLDRLSRVVMRMDAADGQVGTDTRQQPLQKVVADVELNEIPVSAINKVAAAALSSPGPPMADDVVKGPIIQLRAAATSGPLAQRLRSYFRALFFERTAYFTFCSSMLIIAAALGFAITMGLFGSYFLMHCCHPSRFLPSRFPSSLQEIICLVSTSS